MRLTLFMPFILAVIFFTSCATTEITSSWKAENARPHDYKKMLVIGLMPDSVRDFRQQMEKALTDDLKSKGVNAVSAFELYGPKVFRHMSEQQMNKQIKSKGFDGIITISLLNTKEEKNYVPGSITDYTGGYGYPNFWDYYSAAYDRIYEPSYYSTDTDYFWESNLYNLSNGKMIYSVLSRSFDPNTAQSLGKEYGQLILNDLIRNGVITNKVLTNK